MLDCLFVAELGASGAARLGVTHGDAAVAALALPYCFPYPATRSTAHPRTEFVFTLAVEGSTAKRYGFCRWGLPRGPGGRYGTGRRLPLCVCLVSKSAFFTAWPPVCRLVEGLLLARPAAVAPLLADLAATLPRLLPGETFALRPSFPGGAPYTFVRPNDADGPDADVPVAPLLAALGPRAFVAVLSAVMSEKRIVFFAAKLGKLSACVLAAARALRPFHWQHMFVPVLPEAMLSYVCAPMPFLVGVPSGRREAVEDMELSDVLFVDLDAAALSVTADSELPLWHDPLVSGVERSRGSVGRRLSTAMGSTFEALAPPEPSAAHSDAAAALHDELAAAARPPGKAKTRGLLGAGKLLGKAAAAAGRALGRGGDGADGGLGGLGGAADKPPPVNEPAAQAALLGFHVALFGDPALYGGIPKGAPRSEQIAGVRRRFVECTAGCGFSRATEHFAADVSESQMFECFAFEYRDVLGGDDGLTGAQAGFGGAGKAGTGPFFRAADLLRRQRKPFTIAGVKRAVASLNLRYRGMSAADHSVDVAEDGEPGALHKLTLALTSNTAYAGDRAEALAAVARDAHGAAALDAILRTLWWRLEDSLGFNWKHANLALAVLEGLVLGGPEAALPEVLARLHTVRRLVAYRSGIGAGFHIRLRAKRLVPLLLDHRRLAVWRARTLCRATEAPARAAACRARLQGRGGRIARLADAHELLRPHPAALRSTGPALAAVGAAAPAAGHRRPSVLAAAAAFSAFEVDGAVQNGFEDFEDADRNDAAAPAAGRSSNPMGGGGSGGGRRDSESLWTGGGGGGGGGGGDDWLAAAPAGGDFDWSAGGSGAAPAPAPAPAPAAASWTEFGGGAAAVAAAPRPAPVWDEFGVEPRAAVAAVAAVAAPAAMMAPMGMAPAPMAVAAAPTTMAAPPAVPFDPFSAFDLTAAAPRQPAPPVPPPAPSTKPAAAFGSRADKISGMGLAAAAAPAPASKKPEASGGGGGGDAFAGLAW